MNKVLITGGAGFIGYHLCRKLVEKEYEVHILDNFSRGVMDEELNKLSKNKKVKIIDFDLLNPSSFESLEKDYNYIYHFAAIIGVQHVLDSPFDVISKNFLLLNNAIKVAKSQIDLKRFVFASTSEVYAGTLMHYGLEFPTPENTPLTITNLSEKRTSYMLSKIYGEAMVQHSGLPSINFRPHNLYGPRMGFRHVIPQLYEKALKSRDGSLAVFSPDHTRCFCFIDDATELLWRLMRIHVASATTVNIGRQNEEINMRGLAEKIIEMAGLDLFIVEAEETLGSPKRRAPDMNLCEALTGYKSAISLEDGLQRTINWYQKILRHN